MYTYISISIFWKETLVCHSPLSVEQRLLVALSQVCNWIVNRIENANAGMGLNLFEGSDQRITSSEIARVRRSNTTNLNVYRRKSSDSKISRTATSFERPYGADAQLTFQSESDHMGILTGSEANDSESSHSAIENGQNQNENDKKEDISVEINEKLSPKKFRFSRFMGIFIGLNLWIRDEKSLNTFWGVFEPSFQVGILYSIQNRQGHDTVLMS